MEKDDRSQLIVPLWILALLGVGMLMHTAAGIFLWVTASFFLFALLDPWFLELRRRKFPALLAALLLILFSVAVCSLIVFLLFRFSSNIIEELEDTKRVLIGYYDSFTSSFNEWVKGFAHPLTATPAPGTVVPKAIPKVEMVESSPFGGELGLTLMHGLGSALTVLTFAFLWPILTFFFIVERTNLGKVIGRAFTDANRSHVIWTKIVAATRAFFLGNLVLAVVSYPIFLMLFVLFNVKSPFTQAALASFFNIVPFLGSVLAGFLPSLALLSQTENLGLVIALYSCCVGVHFTIANFVTPKVLGSRVDINATTSTIALIVWGELWGGLGLLLAIPLTALIKILLENSGYAWPQWFASLMSEKVVDKSIQSKRMKDTEA
ncbi:AI-2E family transporter [soil metagenome]